MSRDRIIAAAVAAAVAVGLSGCAALKAGWARVNWTDGKVSPVVACTARINPEGDVEMDCTPLNKIETDLLWKREKRRSGEDTL